MKDQKCLTCLEEAPTFNVLDSSVLLYPCCEKFTRRQYHEQRETRSTASPHRGMSLPARTITRITRNNPSQLTTCHPVNVPSMRQRTHQCYSRGSKKWVLKVCLTDWLLRLIKKIKTYSRGDDIFVSWLPQNSLQVSNHTNVIINTDITMCHVPCINRRSTEEVWDLNVQPNSKWSVPEVCLCVCLCSRSLFMKYRCSLYKGKTCIWVNMSGIMS